MNNDNIKSDSDDTGNNSQVIKPAIPTRYFVYISIVLFIVGIIGMAVEASTENIKYLLIYFSLSFFIAPAFMVYPIIRSFLGDEDSILAAILSMAFGHYFQSNIKKWINKH